MRKIFLLSFTVVAIVVAAFNVNMNMNGSKFSDLGLANVEALAQGEDCYGVKVACIYTEQDENIYYTHYMYGIDTKKTVITKKTSCEGTGSQCCYFGSETISDTLEFVPCNKNNHD